jgi:hypothetical protein
MSWRETIAADAEAPLDDDFGRGRGHCATCGAEWDGFKICHCSLCHLTFTAVGGFDFHRTGPAADRRCRTQAELTEKGYEPNSHGQWRKPAPADLFDGLGES